MTKKPITQAVIESFKWLDSLCTPPMYLDRLGPVRDWAKAYFAAEQSVCGCCNGSGWVTRDPDIGTDQQCPSCDGTGKDPDALIIGAREVGEVRKDICGAPFAVLLTSVDENGNEWQTGTKLYAEPTETPSVPLLERAEKIVLSAIQRMRAAHVHCQDLIRDAESFLQDTARAQSESQSKTEAPAQDSKECKLIESLFNNPEELDAEIERLLKIKMSRFPESSGSYLEAMRARTVQAERRADAAVAAVRSINNDAAGFLRIYDAERSQVEGGEAPKGRNEEGRVEDPS